MKRTTQLCLENTATNKQYVDMLKDLLKYGKLNTNSPPLRVKDIEAITKDLNTSYLASRRLLKTLWKQVDHTIQARWI